MKKIVIVLMVVLLAACGNSVDASQIDEQINIMKAHAETAGTDREGYMSTLKEFNEYLETIEDKDYEEYVTIQMEANNMRYKGLENDDSDLISDSAWKQAQALQILDEIRESE